MTWIIGITGGIGSGKTTVCKIFQGMGVPVYDADSRAKYLMSFDQSLKSEIKALLGKGAYHKNGRLNRAYVAHKIFNDKDLLKGINDLVHPAVHKDAGSWVKKHQTAPYVLYEAALLVENGSYKAFNKLIVVTAPEPLRIDRVVKRDHSTRKQVELRVANQLPEEKKVEVADYIINNDETSSIVKLVVALHRKILREINDNLS